MTAFERVTVFGGIAIDRIARTADSPIMGASNPGRVRVSPGGVGLNVAMTLARLGLDVRIAGIVGADADGELARTSAVAAGVDVGCLQTSRTTPTATYVAILDNRGDLLLGIADTEVNSELDPERFKTATEGASSSGVWVIDANLGSETLSFLVDKAESAGRPIAALPISPAKATRLTPFLERLTYLFANRREAAAILGRPIGEDSPSPVDLATELGSRIGSLVVTSSAEPLAAFAGEQTRTYRPPRVKIGSVNGAGDALAAGTLYGLSIGHGWFDALHFGLAAAALSAESEETVRTDLTPALIAGRIEGGPT